MSQARGPASKQRNGGAPAKTPGRPRVGQERARRTTRATTAAANGSTPPAAATVERGRAYARLYGEWRSGVDTATLAERYSLSERRVREVIDQLRAGSIAELALDSPVLPITVAHDLILRHEAALAEAADLAREAREANNLPVAVAAMRRRDEALKSYTALLQELGLLPRDLGAIRVHASAVDVVRTILDTFERFGVADEVGEAVAATIEMRTRRDRGRLELDVRSERQRASDAAAD